jgi:hypothetical protein
MEIVHLSVLKPSSSGGRDDLEYATDEDMRLVSLTTHPLLTGLTGYNAHPQLRDNFAISSVGMLFR